MRRLVLSFLFHFFILLSFLQSASACDSCGSAFARVSSDGKLNQTEKPLFFDFSFEQQVWHKREAALAHRLHHQGHHVHDKTHEEFYHFGLGANAGQFSIFTELPYVVRHSIEVDDHEFLGQRQRSEAFGDLKLTSILKAINKEGGYLGPLAGIKFPTGSTTEKNKQREKFEPELQPGSGSFDPYIGSAFQLKKRRFSLSGNMLYTFRTEGAQEFKFGNLFSSYIFVDYLLNPKSQNFLTRIGLDTTLQNEQKQKERTGRIKDSGGTTWLMGPMLSVRGNRSVSIFANILFPVYQNLGGVHQEVQFVWNSGFKIAI